jgi:hypothetical protein
MFKCSTWNILQIILTTVIISGTFQSIVAILQFIEQKSLGLSILRESVLSPSSSGVAKIVLGGETFIRSYGFFPHPNILATFLVVSLLTMIVYPMLFTLEMFHVEHSNNKKIVPRGTIFSLLNRIIEKYFPWNKSNSNHDKMFHVEQFKYLYIYRIVFFLQLLALVLTFSKSAVIGFIIGVSVLVLGIKKMFHVEHYSDRENVPRGTSIELKPDGSRECSTWNICISRIKTTKKMFHVEHLFILFGIVFFVIIFTIVNLEYFVVQPLFERIFYIQSLIVLVQTNLFSGLGIGQFVLRIQDFFDEKLLSWQFQPIHNVFLLILSEEGIVGLGLFLWFIYYTYLKNDENVPRGTIGKDDRAKCSTWNIWKLSIMKMFHVEHFHGDNLVASSKGDKEAVKSLLIRAILVVILFSMLFDHFLWDIEQGKLLFWIVLALAVLKNRN